MLLDISRPLSVQSEPWPGDVPLTWRLSSTLGVGGAPANTGAFSMSTHLGTHVDAPWHFLPEGAKVEQLPLDAFVGKARVVDARGAVDLVQPGASLLRQMEGAERVLLRTFGAGATDPFAFPKRFAGISPALADELASRGVKLVGTDAPSVDRFGAANLPAHHALARGGCQIVEGLDLGAVKPGDYELIALPLRLDGLDASPVRAVLRA